MKLTIKEALIKGIEAHRRGNIHRADQLYTAVLQVQPNNPDANHNMGVLAVGIGKLEESLPFFKNAVESNKTVTQYWLSYINVLIQLNRINEAKDIFNQAIDKGINISELQQFVDKIKLGNSNIDDQNPSEDQIKKLLTLQAEGKLINSLDEAKELLLRYSNSFFLYNFIGAINLQLNDIDSSIKFLKKAIKLNSKDPIVHTNLGRALYASEKYIESIYSYKKVLDINPDRKEALYAIPEILKKYNFDSYEPELYEMFISLIEKNILDSDISAKSIKRLLLNDPIIRQILERENTDIFDEKFIEDISLLSKIPLFLKFISICKLSDLKLEKFLKSIRLNILNFVINNEVSFDFLNFQSALALHCFTNEYLYGFIEEEINLIKILEDKVESILSAGEQPDQSQILCLASYKPLHKYKWCHSISFLEQQKEVKRRFIQEPEEEIKLRSKIPTLKSINNKISIKVKNQYEEHPYPRWTTASLPIKPFSLSILQENYNLNFFTTKIEKISTPEILIAGCGTGREAIATAQQIKDSKVLAIDLSKASLAYAKRKSNELKLQNIEFLQADILEVNKIDRKFDMIESSGVLHHMDDPFQGLKTLTHSLKDQGVMRIGLYSQLGRNSIEKIREEIKNLEIGSSEKEMIAFRNHIILSKEEHHVDVRNYADFYSLSEFRDLLFHVNEHRFNILKIKKYLYQLGLIFCGFELTSNYQNLDTIGIKKSEIYDLNKWVPVEKTNPHFFAEMYNFWCTKK